jgi:hypothetical protein
MPKANQVVKTTLPNGAIMHVEAARLGSLEQDVAFDPSKAIDFAGVSRSLEGISEAIVCSLQKVKPRKATVEFGLEIGLESGQLTALIVKGSGTANLNISLEWGEP